jgi:hypothetical protein
LDAFYEKGFLGWNMLQGWIVYNARSKKGKGGKQNEEKKRMKGKKIPDNDL